MLGLCATEESAAAFVRAPFEVRAADISRRESLPADFGRPDVLVHCASSGRGGVDAYRAVYRDGLRNLLEALRPRHVIFVGSTSVYGQTRGEWVDETSPAEPGVETGRVLLEAEALALAAGGCVLRLSALYGPARSVLMKKYLSGTAVLEDGGGRWVNQIHRDDAARAILRVAGGGLDGIFNVSDNRPATQREVYGWIAAHFGGDLPAEGPANPHRKRGVTNKRVSNNKLRASGWEPLHGDFRDALSAGAVSAA